MNLLEQAEHWAVKAEGHRNKGLTLPAGRCQQTMRMLALEEDYLAELAVTHALAFEAVRRREHTKDEAMLSKSGLHPYRAALFFILRESERAGPKSRAALVAGDVAEISNRQTVRMLAAMFDKTSREVARDLITTYRAIEDGATAP